MRYDSIICMSTRMTFLLSMIFSMLFSVLSLDPEAVMASQKRDHQEGIMNRWKGNEGKLKELIPVLKNDPEWHTSSQYRELMDALEPPPASLASWEGKRDLSGADLNGVDLQGALLSGADLRLTNFSNANLDGADLSNTTLIKANLDNANLNRTNLSEADLWGANLSKASLYRANLRNASLFQAKLIEASLIEINLSGARLQEADLSNAYLSNANLSKAKLIFANLSKTVLNNSNLSEADLEGANLDMAYMWSADMRAVVFEIRPASLPNFPSIITAKNLSSMTFKESPHSLVELREAFKGAGLRNKEREITFAVEHGKRVKAWKDGVFGKLESIFKWLFFEVTCKYGLSPGRPLIIIFALILFFAFPYSFAVATIGKDGIWMVWPTDTIQVDVIRLNPERITKGGIGAVRIGLYFSVLSAFNIGWRDFNVGDWIARMQPRDYTLRPTGWVRTVSGVQSLISLYLLALWLLVYFGRPFQQIT